VSEDQVRLISAYLNDHVDASLWPAILAAGSTDLLPDQDHGRWLADAIDVTWTAAPPRGEIQVRAHAVTGPEGATPSGLSLCTVALHRGVPIAEVVTRLRLRGADDGARSIEVGVPPTSAESSLRVVTPEEVASYCDALRTPPWSTAGLLWAGVVARPQPVVPVSLLASIAARAMPPLARRLRAAIAAPVLAGSLTRWVSTSAHVWVLDPGGDPIIRFDLADKEPDRP
jgi:hypothetical protein